MTNGKALIFSVYNHPGKNATLLQFPVRHRSETHLSAAHHVRIMTSTICAVSTRFVPLSMLHFCR